MSMNESLLPNAFDFCAEMMFPVTVSTTVPVLPILPTSIVPDLIFELGK